MTSRRSRLKAVTNLPVRRKPLTSQGSGNETVNTLTSEAVSLSAVTGEDIRSNTSKHTSFIEEKQLTDNSTNCKGNEAVINENCDVGVKSNKSISEEVVVSKVIESNAFEVTENFSESNIPCNSYNFKSENTNGPLFRSSKRFKPNLVSLGREREQSHVFDERNEKESSKELNYINIGNSNYYNSNNNIVEEGFKCYTVLTSKSVALSPLSEYTITPLTPYSNSFDATADEVDPSQDCKEAPLYTAIEHTELFINSEINGNFGSTIDTQSFEPVLTNLTNCNNENDLKSKNYCLNKNYAEVQNVSENLDKKPVVKNRGINIRNNFTGTNEHYGNSVGQLKDSHILENTISSISLNVSTDLPSHKQNNSTVRRRRSKYNDFTKKLADAKREFQKKYEKTKPDRSTLKMIDLIFYNPATNPMESKGKLEKKDTSVPASGVIADLLAEEKVDEPESMDSNSKLSDSCDTESTNKMPVPQVKIGLDGEIILDEKSLVIETTDAKKGREGLQNSVPIFEDREYKVSYYRGKSKKTRDWTDFETKRFYKALNTIGPDFTLMQKYFPKRSRLELKNKFKREERLNRSLIDKALNNPSEFDMTQLEKDLAVEKEAEEVELEMRLCRIMKRAARKPRVKTSYLSREIIETDEDSEEDQPESFSMTAQALSESEKNKKEKEFNFVFQQLLAKESKKSVTIVPEISSASSNAFQYSEHGLT